MKLFQYAVIYVPKEEEGKKRSEKPKVVVDITSVLAADQQQATLLAARAIPEEYLDRLDRLEVAVRPF